MGQVQRGLTPQQQAAIPALQFMRQPLPDVSINAPLPEMEAALAGLQGMQPPSFGGFGMSAPIGLAEGGVIEMGRGNDGIFSMKPQSFIVGEGGPEVLTVGGGKVQVTPLAGGAQGGLSINQALSPMLTAAGFSPGTTPYVTGYDRIGGMTTGSTAAQLMGLGFVPEFVRDPNTGAIWQIRDGYRRQILDPESLAGIRPQDVMAAYPSEIAQFAPNIESYARDPATGMIFRLRGDTREYIGDPSVLAGIRPSEARQIPLSQIEAEAPKYGGVLGYGAQLNPPRTGAFGTMGTPLMDSTTGTLMPAPFKIAPQLLQWSQARPDLYANALSAYGSALDPVTGLPTGGLTRDVIESQMRNASLFGSGIRGTAV